jgi:dTDP-4-amino-4,6-dideoxygalactose transaminase
MNDKKIAVTSPFLPPLSEFVPYLADIWERKWITNNGYYHCELEKSLCQYLGIDFISLFTNGTLPLITALQALRVTGEVITTPYSFVATTHALWWNGIKPVFVDVDPKTGNLDPDKIEAAITPKTTGIMPVHVYGNPCETERIAEIAEKYGLKVIYDAAHAFGVKVNGKSILTSGDMSTLSFHATKVFNTIEGGALICRDGATKSRIDNLKNFGFVDEVTVVMPGINSKMDELRAAFGLLNLKYIDGAIEQRKKIVQQYREVLGGIEGISFFEDMPGVRHNYSYFPIFVDEARYGMSRDCLYEKMKSKNIFGRRYFYPLISTFSAYKGLESADPSKLPIAHKIAESVICLPLHAEMTAEETVRVIESLEK